MKVILLLIIALCPGSLFARSYYLSDHGDDRQSGRSTLTAWRNLSMLLNPANTLQTGDSVLLERGSTFRGHINVTGLRIYIGAYGAGPKPIILGSVPVNHWKALGKNTWVSDCKDCNAEPVNLFVDGKWQMMARYPNKGYLPISSTAKKGLVLSDSTSFFPDGYWNQAELVIRSSRWTIDILPVASHKGKSFFTLTPPAYPVENGSGYFLQKHIAALDQNGEWFFEKKTKRIFLWLDAGKSPVGSLIEVSQQKVGLNVFKSNHVTVENLSFKHQQSAGVNITGAANIRLNGIDVFFSGRNGLELVSCQNPIVKNSLIMGSNNNGVEWHNNVAGAFLSNSIQQTGLHAGQGASGDGSYLALHITSDLPSYRSSLFQYNTIDGVGYSAIDFRTGHTIIKNNFIANFCLIKDDGAGIYSWRNSNADNVIESNIILHGPGAGEGTVRSGEGFASGIYMDDGTSEVLIKGNTISKCVQAGIFLHNATNISIIENTLFDNGNNIFNRERGQLYIKLDALAGVVNYDSLHLNVTRNKMFVGIKESHCIYVNINGDLPDLGIFELNMYSATYPYQFLVLSNSQTGFCQAPENISLAYWRKITKYESQSIFSIQPPVRNDDAENMISHGMMNHDMRGWMVWPAESSLTYVDRGIAPGRSLKINIPTGRSEALVYHQGFSLNKDKFYRLSFTARGLIRSRIEFVSLMTQAPWAPISEYACFSLDTINGNFTYLFKPLKSIEDARINFKGNSTFWIDQVSLVEIEEDQYPTGSVKLIYNSSKELQRIPATKSVFNERDSVSDLMILLPYQSKIVFQF